MSNKILTAVFVILSVVLLGEIGYFFYSSRQPALKNKLIPTTEKSISSTSQPERQGTQAIKDNVLNYLSVANSGVLKSSILTNHYEGTITEIDNKSNDPTADYGLKIKFKGENGDINGNGFRYNNDEVSQKLSVFRYIKDAPLEKITIDDLKVGDLISIDDNLNLLDDNLTNFVIAIKITVMP